MKGYQVGWKIGDLLRSSIVCLQVSNSHGLRCILPLLLGLVAISGLGALITCLASRFTMMTRLVVTLAMMTRLAFHNKAAALEHLHSLLLTASLLLFGLAILQVLTVLTTIFSAPAENTQSIGFFRFKIKNA